MARSRTRQPFARRAQSATIISPPTVMADWSRGLVTDLPRVSVPPNAVFNCQNMMFDRQGMAYTRGGWTYLNSSQIAATAGTYTVAWASFPSGGRVLVLGTDLVLYKITTAGAVTSVGSMGANTGFTQIDKPAFFLDKTWFPMANGTNPPKTYNGTTLAVAGGSPPAGRLVAVYKSRIVLASSAANESRIWFSPVPSPEATWDTTNSWVDADYKLTGLAALQNVLLLFSEGFTERIVGSTPPPGTDMDRQPVGPVGCTDARSMVIHEDQAIFANPNGVYITNGVGFTNITKEGGIETYWQNLMNGYRGVREASPWTLAGGVFRDFYIISIVDEAGALVDCLICHLPRRAWWRASNMAASMFATQVGSQTELHMGLRTNPRVAKVSPIFQDPGALVDGDGDAVTGFLVTALFGQGPGVKHFHRGHVTYSAASPGTMTVTAITGVETHSSTILEESPLPHTSGTVDRYPITVSEIDQGLMLYLAQSAACASFRLYALEVEQRPLPGVSGGYTV